MIETERLILTDWQDEDESKLYHLNSNVHVMSYFPSILSKQKNHDFFEQIRLRLQKQGYGLYKVVLKQTNQFVGFVGLNHPQYILPFLCPVEISWRILPEFWYKGLALEAAKEVLHDGFQRIHFNEIFAFTARVNEPSIRLMHRLKMNFQYEFLHPALEKDSVLRNHVLYSIQSPKK